MSEIKLTYVASALTSFARVSGILESADKIGKKEAYKNLLSDIMYRLDGYSNNCNMGSLWNSMTEKRDKEILIGLNSPEKHDLMVQSDSGGLQVITLGLNVSPEEQKESYLRQSRYSHYAMSMDKMPILVNEKLRDSVKSSGGGGQGVKMNHSIKYFVKELRYDAGRTSGGNIKDQIDVFKEDPENIAKVLVIIQGWDLEDYNEYARGVFSVFEEMDTETRDEYYRYIGGISLGTSGIISYFRMFDLYCRAPIDLTEVPERFRSFIHILGLGGNSKSGVLFALKKDFFGKDVHYTYDSTSLTSASTFGRYTKLVEKTTYYNNKSVTYHKMITDNLGRVTTPLVKEFMESIRLEYRDLIEKYLEIDCSDPDFFRNTFSPWRDDQCSGIKDFEEKHNGKGCELAREEYLNAVSMNSFLHFAIETKQFMVILDEMKNGDFHSIGDKEYRKAMMVLSNLNTYEEYMEKREWFKLLLGNKRISTMTIVDTVQDFEKICNASIDEGIDIEEW